MDIPHAPTETLTNASQAGEDRYRSICGAFNDIGDPERMKHANRLSDTDDDEILRIAKHDQKPQEEHVEQLDCLASSVEDEDASVLSDTETPMEMPGIEQAASRPPRTPSFGIDFPLWKTDAAKLKNLLSHNRGLINAFKTKRNAKQPSNLSCRDRSRSRSNDHRIHLALCSDHSAQLETLGDAK